MLEAKVKEKFKKCIDVAFEGEAYSYWPVVQGKFSKRGFPDIFFGYDGNVALFEAKRYGNDLSDLQEQCFINLAKAKLNPVKVTVDKGGKNFVFTKWVWYNDKISDLSWSVNIKAPPKKFKAVIEEILWPRTA